MSQEDEGEHFQPITLSLSRVRVELLDRHISRGKGRKRLPLDTKLTRKHVLTEVMSAAIDALEDSSKMSDLETTLARFR